MRRIWLKLAVCALAGSVAACGGCNDEPQPTEAVEVVDLGPPPEDVARPGDIYKDTFERSKEELDVGAARERLREIEREVVREREELE